MVIKSLSELLSRGIGGNGQPRYDLVWRQFLATCPFAIALVDAEGHFVEASPAFPRLLGYSHPEFLRLTYQQITYPADLSPDIEQHEALLEGRIDSYSMRKRYLRRDGSVIWVLLEVGFVRDLNLAISYVTDISYDAEARQGIEFDNSVKSALLNHEFELHYQPIVALEVNRTVGFEALVRWPQVNGEVLPPGAFMPRISPTTMPALCYEVAQMACEAAKRLPEHLWIAINLSPITVQGSGFDYRFNHIVESSGIARKRLRLELTEEELRDEPILALMLRSLQQQGHTIELDDFFKGFSNFGSLQSLPINVVKIDKSVVQGIGSATEEEAIRFVLAIAEILKFEVIAEGVETEAQAAWLLQNGCKFGQGYYFGRPKPLAAVIEGLKG